MARSTSRINEQTAGLGDKQADFQVFMQNRPQIDPYLDLHSVTPCADGEIEHIGKLCGNGWRKVFNVYAKLMFALKSEQFSQAAGFPSWQAYRDQSLLQNHTNTALVFSAPTWLEPSATCMRPSICPSKHPAREPHIRIVMGRTYAKQVLQDWPLTWKNAAFAICPSQRLVVCPYFDYRQLSNIKIIELVDYINQLILDD